jgi:serine/threonine protein kinase/tetratricopeptide (TPR) repeat protein
MTAHSLFAQAVALPEEERAAFLAQAFAARPELRGQVMDLLLNDNPPSEFSEPVDPHATGEYVPPITPVGGTVVDRVEDSIPPPFATATPVTTMDGSAAAANEPITRIGPYHLLEPLGEGGMGTVYIAQQTEPVQRQVALKLIRPGLDSNEIIRRFEQERQTLALMDHPHIAKVLDAGAVASNQWSVVSKDKMDSPLATDHGPWTMAGRPYFVMELVPGPPITTYCDQQRLSVRARLELFVAVCQAIQHAHQKGIIHRDIKPSNVLVAVYDGQAVPKVIDFGIAKATQQTPRTAQTTYGSIVGTLEYMSPEQADYTTLDIDTRSDIYALGVLLYELLTGTTPLRRETVEKAALSDVLRRIKEEEPPRPSTRLSEVKELPTVSEQRHTEPMALTSQLRGDLDWIVMKALAKERDRRYETANGLAMDVLRYLHDEPVLARPPSVGYRLRKFVRRHRVGVTAAAVVLLALVGGIIGTTWGMIDANEARLAEKEQRHKAEAATEAERQAKYAEKEQRQKAEAATEAERRAKNEEAVARRKAEKAEQEARESEADTQSFSKFLVDDVLSVARPEGVRGGLGMEVTVRRALTEAAKKIPERFKGRPRAEALARHDLGVTFRLVGEPALAVEQLQHAYNLRRKLFGPDDVTTLHSANSLAAAYDAAGQRSQALTLFTEVYRRRKATQGPHHQDTLHSMNNLAVGYQQLGQYEKAAELLDEVCQLRQETLGPDHPFTLNSMNNLATVYARADKPAQAVALLEEVVELSRGKVGPEHPDTLAFMTNLAEVYWMAGQRAQGYATAQAALALQEKKLGADHPLTMSTLNNLGQAHKEDGHLEQAIPMLEKVLGLRQGKLGPNHPQTLTTMNNLATAYFAAGKVATAIPLLEQSLAQRKLRLGAEHPETLQSLSNLAAVYAQEHRFADAARLRQELVPILRRKLPAEHPTLVSNVTQLGQHLLAAGQPQEAEPLLREALALHEKQSPEAWKTFYLRSHLGSALQQQQQFAAAEPLLRQGYEGLKQRAAQIPAEARQGCLLEALGRLVQLYEAWQKPEEAERWRREAEVLKKGKGQARP